MSLPTADEFLARLESSPRLCAEFDLFRATEAPHASRREAIALVLAAVQARRAEITAKRQALAAARVRIAALEKARAARAAAKAHTPPPSRPDKRQPLPLAAWKTEHLHRAAQAGDTAARAELARRGYTVSGNTLSRSLT
jgi:hypothetical protein